MYENLIILAAGASSRMKSSMAPKGLSEADIAAATSHSKALIGYGEHGRPILDFLLFNAEKAGYKEVLMIISPQTDAFKTYYGSKDKGNPFHKLRISYAYQHIPKGREKPLGTADALFQALEQYPKLQKTSFTVCNSDNLYSVEALEKLRMTDAPNALIGYDRDGLEFTMERISRFALLELDAENYLTDIVEKPDINETTRYTDEFGTLRVSMNIFKFSGTQFYPFLKDCPVHPQRNEKELPTALLNMCEKHPKACLGIPMKEHVPDLTSKEDILVFRQYLNNKSN